MIGEAPKSNRKEEQLMDIRKFAKSIGFAAALLAVLPQRPRHVERTLSRIPRIWLAPKAVCIKPITRPRWL